MRVRTLDQIGSLLLMVEQSLVRFLMVVALQIATRRVLQMFTLIVVAANVEMIAPGRQLL